jgi:hypothetical protein
MVTLQQTNIGYFRMLFNILSKLSSEEKYQVQEKMVCMYAGYGFIAPLSEVEVSVTNLTMENKCQNTRNNFTYLGDGMRKNEEMEQKNFSSSLLYHWNHLQ